MKPWRPVDWFGKQIFEKWTPLWQIRTGVLSVVAGVVLVLSGFFINEPPLIYQMSAWAILLGGMGVVITAVLALNEMENVNNIQDLQDEQERK